MGQPQSERSQTVGEPEIASAERTSKPSRRPDIIALITSACANETNEPFGALFLLNPINRDLEFETAVTLGTTETPLWRQDVASKILSKWKEGGNVWVERRCLSTRPRAEWNWTEGDDPRVSWADINAFFSQLKIGEPVGGEDGFMLLQPTPENEPYLRDLLHEIAPRR